VVNVGDIIAGAEIISMDSMQVYRFMDIGTAKPSIEERGSIPHHLLDVADPDEEYNAARFVKDAQEAITVIRANKRLPLLTGGTGLYLKALQYGLFSINDVDQETRKTLARELEEGGCLAFHEKLQLVDPESAGRIHPNDKQRLLRAMEVFVSTGIPWSEHLARQKRNIPTAQNILKIGLKRDRNELYERINQRTHQMVDLGLQEEVQRLLDLGYDPELNSMQSIGYRHMVHFLSGAWQYPEMIRLLSRDTRWYAKRQLTPEHDFVFQYIHERDAADYRANTYSYGYMQTRFFAGGNTIFGADYIHNVEETGHPDTWGNVLELGGRYNANGWLTIEGSTDLRAYSRDSHTFIGGHVNTTMRYFKKNAFTLRYQRDLLDILDDIRGHRYGAESNVYFNSSVLLTTSYNYADYSDGNINQDWYHNLTFLALKKKPDLHFAVGYRYRDFSMDSPDYY